MTNGWGIYGSNGWDSYCFLGDIQKNTGLQRSTLSSPRMTMVLVTLNSWLQKGRDHSPPKFCFDEPSFWLAQSAMGIDSAMSIWITKQIGGGAEWVELLLGWARVSPTLVSRIVDFSYMCIYISVVRIPYVSNYNLTCLRTKVKLPLEDTAVRRHKSQETSRRETRA